MTTIPELKARYDDLRNSLSQRHDNDTAHRLHSLEDQLAGLHAADQVEAAAQLGVLIDLLHDHFDGETPMEQLARSVLDVLAVQDQ
jgi:hypothetical protein